MALKDQPYLPLYVLDFMTDERLRECSAESCGVYIMTMCFLHKSKEYGTVSLNDRDRKTGDDIRDYAIKLTKHLPYSEEVIDRSLRELLDMEVLKIDEEKLYQKRMVHDEALSRKRSKAGRAGMENRYSRKPEDAADVVITKTEEVAAEEQQARPKKSQKEIVDERFDIFWAAYPRKTNKGGARKAWAKLHPSKELFERIMAAVEEAKKCEQWQKEKGQYIPYPATWLNGERWDDSYDNSSPQCTEGFDPEDPFSDWRGAGHG